MLGLAWLRRASRLDLCAAAQRRALGPAFALACDWRLAQAGRQGGRAPLSGEGSLVSRLLQALREARHVLRDTGVVAARRAEPRRHVDGQTTGLPRGGRPLSYSARAVCAPALSRTGIYTWTGGQAAPARWCGSACSTGVRLRRETHGGAHTPRGVSIRVGCRHGMAARQSTRRRSHRGARRARSLTVAREANTLLHEAVEVRAARIAFSAHVRPLCSGHGPPTAL